MAGERVLIVDDNEANVELAKFVLEDASFVVDSVANPANAMPRVASFLPDLILMDIRLPGSDGLHLTRALKSDPVTQGIVIVAFTAHAMKGDEARFLSEGCDAYIAKPIDVTSFARRVRSALESHRPNDPGEVPH